MHLRSSIHVWQTGETGPRNLKLFKRTALTTVAQHDRLMFVPRFHVYRGSSCLFFDVCCAASREACLCFSCTTRQDGQITWRLKLQPENALTVCTDWDFVASAVTSSPIGKRGNSLIWFISSALIHWPVLLWALSVVWAKPAWEELQGNWLYCKFNQREPPKCSLL